jgi:hypothetical protein
VGVPLVQREEVSAAVNRKLILCTTTIVIQQEVASS